MSDDTRLPPAREENPPGEEFPSQAEGDEETVDKDLQQKGDKPKK